MAGCRGVAGSSAQVLLSKREQCRAFGCGAAAAAAAAAGLLTVCFTARPAAHALSPSAPLPQVLWTFSICLLHSFACMLTSPGSTSLQVLWTFSIYLEAVAILPQLVLMQRTQNIDNLTANYVALLGCGGGSRSRGVQVMGVQDRLLRPGCCSC